MSDLLRDILFSHVRLFTAHFFLRTLTAYCSFTLLCIHRLLHRFPAMTDCILELFPRAIVILAGPEDARIWFNGRPVTALVAGVSGQGIAIAISGLEPIIVKSAGRKIGFVMVAEVRIIAAHGGGLLGATPG